MKTPVTKRTVRKAYDAPKVVVYGKVSELTQGGHGGKGSKGQGKKNRGSKGRGHGGSRS